MKATETEGEAVSRQNVERVRRGLEAYNAADWTALRQLYDPDVVMYHLEGWPEPGPSVGREAVMLEIQQLHDTLDVQTVEIMDIVDGGDRVVARYRWCGRSRGPETEMEFTFVFTLRNGKIISEEHFWDHAEALRAVGLSE